MADSDSILTSTKKVLGITKDDKSFDLDVLMHINSVFSTLNQLGIGPDVGFEIVDDSAVWVDFLGDDLRLNHVRTYVHLRVRLLFDPPTSSYHTEALKEQIREHEWRLTLQHDTSEEDEPIVL